MARQILAHDLSPILGAAEQWIANCLIDDRSVFLSDARWTVPLVDEVYGAFVEHPDYGGDDFLTKLKGQMARASPPAQQLMAEMLWALLLFPSNMKAKTKRQQIREIWALSGAQLAEQHPLLVDNVLVGIGSGGPGFNNYRPNELEFLLAVTRDVKQKPTVERRRLLTEYEAFVHWIDGVPREGSRQFRHMLRFFAFPDRVERMSSNNDRRKILKTFGAGPSRDVEEWNDRELDDKLLDLRNRLQQHHPSNVLDFYEQPLRERWLGERTIKTVAGEVSVTVPDDDEGEDREPIPGAKTPEARLSFQIQAKLARIGAVMGFNVWLPPADKTRVSELVPEEHHKAFLDELPLSYDHATLDTIKLIDVLWLRRRSIVRAFEVEHTTAVYSGLLRMADLLALQPNMAIQLHIVAAEERRDKVFREMKRPVFSLLERGPLANTCTFISYDSVDAINNLEHLAHTNESIIAEYAESSEES